MRQLNDGHLVSWGSVIIAALAVLILLPACLTGCGNATSAYKSRWVDVVSAFEAQVTKDDQKSTELVQSNDATGVMDLLDQRMKYVDTAYDKLVGLRPTADLRDLHAATLFYLTSIKSQLKANSDLYDAAHAGKPTTDLQTIAEDAVKQTEAVRVVLGLAMDKAGVKIKAIKPKEQPKSSAPQTIPR